MRQKILLTCAALAALAGCTVAPKQGYPGPRLAPEAEAVLSASGKHSVVGFHKKTFISKVNGESMRDTGAMLAGQRFPYPHKVYLPAGRHTVELVVLLGLSYATGEVWFDAEVGEMYTAESEVNGYKVRMWIADKSGKPVGGIAPAPRSE